MASLMRAAVVPLALIAMAAGPDDVRSRAAAADPVEAADSGDTLRPLRPLVPVRLRQVRPAGVRIHSVRDNRVRVLHPAWPATVDTTRAAIGTKLPATSYPATASMDLSSLEARLREYFDRRLLEFETRQNATLAALSRPPAAYPAIRDTVFIARPSVRRDTVFVARPSAPRDTVYLSAPGAASPRPAAPETTYVVQTIRDRSVKESAVRDIITGTAATGLIAGSVAGTDTARVDTVYVVRAVPVDSAAATPRVDERSFPPAPEIEFVERAVLDTGLLRTVNVVFEVNQASLLPPSMPVLNSLGRVLVRYSDIRLEIGGHTDAMGSRDYNLVLSQARADSVRAYLVSTFPISPSRLIARGYGEDSPVASNATPTGRTLNRRVEFTVIRPDTTRR